MQLNIDKLDFQKLDKNGLAILIQWAKEEGWNPGPYDIEAYWAADTNGYYGYFHEDKLIAGGSIVSYNGEFGFMGFFIVKPEYRSNGMGRKLWYQRRDKLISRLNEGATIGMDGVVDMQPFYEKGGFKICFRDERHERLGDKFDYSSNISEIGTSDFKSILEYDKQCFGYDRNTFLEAWLKLPEIKSFKFTTNGELKGFTVLRKADVGYKICPLFADNYETAQELFKACLSSVPGKPVYLDIPMVNESAIELTKKFNTQYTFECARMYYGKPPNVALEKIFGVTTFELG